MAETIITVHGEFQIHHPAQRGVVQLIVGFEGARREDVLENTTRLHRELSEEISRMTDPSAGPVTRWSSDQIRVWGARPWSQDGSQLPIVYHGAADVDVTFSDLARLGHWLAGVALKDGLTVQGVEWALTEETRETLTKEARWRAVENAVAKATVFATSVELSSIRPLALSDPGMLGEGPGASTGATPEVLMHARISPSDSQSLDLKPREITIEVAVHARFAAS